LTAAQLERKRANDREAQRAIRQRTKDHIDKLERRIAELSVSQSDNEKLQHALERNAALEQEVFELRQRLDNAAAALTLSGVDGMQTSKTVSSLMSGSELLSRNFWSMLMMLTTPGVGGKKPPKGMVVSVICFMAIHQQIFQLTSALLQA
jgi:hypothetical protein